MQLVAIIGGSGLTNLKNLVITRREVLRTPFGEPSAPLILVISAVRMRCFWRVTAMAIPSRRMT